VSSRSSDDDSHSNDRWKGPLTRGRKRKPNNLASSDLVGNENYNVAIVVKMIKLLNLRNTNGHHMLSAEPVFI
jgi:hypothetical protein